jgi:membrane fusion protein (multidrug efflux system)
VKSIHFESGQPVAAGTLLVQLDDEADRADLAKLVAARTLAELNFQRLKILIPGKTVSQSSYDEAKATLDGAVAMVAESRANIAKKAVRAPFTGVLGIRSVDLGQYLAPGSAIVSLQALNPVYADYSLPERYLGKLSVGQPVEVRVQAYPERVFAGTISAVSPRIESATRSVRLRATLDNPDLALKPGMYAEVDTALPAIDKVMTLPERAIAYNPYGNSVFFIEEKDGGLVVQSRQIKTGEVRDGRIEIIEGLKEGDQVVSDGLNKLRNGQAVKIDNSVRLDASPAAP